MCTDVFLWAETVALLIVITHVAAATDMCVLTCTPHTIKSLGGFKIIITQVISYLPTVRLPWDALLHTLKEEDPFFSFFFLRRPFCTQRFSCAPLSCDYENASDFFLWKCHSNLCQIGGEGA